MEQTAGHRQKCCRYIGEHGVPLIKAVNTIESGCRDLKGMVEAARSIERSNWKQTIHDRIHNL